MWNSNNKQLYQLRQKKISLISKKQKAPEWGKNASCVLKNAGMKKSLKVIFKNVYNFTFRWFWYHL